MIFGSRRQSSWLTAIGIVLLFSIVFVVAMLMYGFTSIPWGNWQKILHGSLFFAVMGAYYGTIAVLDFRSEITKADHAFWRTLLCGVFGALLVFLNQGLPPHVFNTTWIVVGAMLGGLLGWLGWSWAKYIDF